MAKITVTLDSGESLSFEVDSRYPWSERSERDKAVLTLLRRVIEPYMTETADESVGGMSLAEVRRRVIAANEFLRTAPPSIPADEVLEHLDGLVDTVGALFAE